MTKRFILAPTILFVLLAGLVFLQTPLMSYWRGFIWNTWTATIGRLGQVGPLEIDNNVYQQLQKLQTENIRLHAELNDYQQLRRQLGTPTFESFRAIPAAITGQPLDIFHTRHLLNQGSAEGVIPGAPVVQGGSTLVGFISELYEHSSMLELLWHPATNLAVEIIDQDSHQAIGRGLLQGQQYTAVRLTTVPRDVELKPGAIVVTLARQTAVPGGLTIGTIEEITRAQNEAYQEASVRLSYDPQAIDAAVIIVPP